MKVDINATFISVCLADSMQIHKMTDAANINQTDDNYTFNEYNGDGQNQADYSMHCQC